MNKLTPLAKGVITAAAMLGLTLFIHYTHQSPDSKLTYLIYLLYAGGIIWTLIEYALFVNGSPSFAELFGQGFRCFIIITLVMVTFTAIFFAAHPEFAEQDAKLYREYLEQEAKKNSNADTITMKGKNTDAGKRVPDRTPAEREEMVAAEKKQYTTKLVYSAIFGYLILGSIITAAGSAIIVLRRK